MLNFIIGALVGALCGILLMALMSANNDKEE